MHGRTSAVSHDGDPLFRGIPSGRQYDVVRYHSLCVDPATLDDRAVVPLAWTCAAGADSLEEGKSDGDGVRRVMMAAKHISYPHYGVQFHPESICTTYGQALMGTFHYALGRHTLSHFPLSLVSLTSHVSLVQQRTFGTWRPPGTRERRAPHETHGARKQRTQSHPRRRPNPSRPTQQSAVRGSASRWKSSRGA